MSACLYACSSLGQLNRYLESSSADDAAMLQRVSPASFSNRGLYVDGSSVFASALLLAMILAFAFNRILGLDRFVAKAAVAWKERQETRRRDAVHNARVELEGSWEDKERGGDSAGPPRPPDGPGLGPG